MSNPTNGQHRAKQHDQQLAWLRARHELLAHLPGVTHDPTRAQAEALDSAVRQMQHVRLYSPNTRAATVRWGIRLLVSEVRGEPVSAKDTRWALRGAKELEAG